jgi:hypothetical protein
VVDVPSGRQPSGAVEALSVLRLSQRAVHPGQAHPLGTEEELVEALGIDQISVARRDHRRPLGLHKRADERGELHQPAPDSWPQSEGVVEARLEDGRVPDLLPPREVIDEAVFGRSMTLPEPLQLGQRHADDYGYELCFQ